MASPPIEPERWAAEAAVDRAVESRRRRHHLEAQLREETGLAAVLLASAVQGTRIELSTTGPGIAGTVTAVGDDHLSLDSGAHTHVVALAAVTAVRVKATSPVGPGTNAGREASTIAEVLADLQAVGREIHLRWMPDGSCRGLVTSVGADVVTVTRPGGGTEVYHVALAHLVSITFAGHGADTLW